MTLTYTQKKSKLEQFHSANRRMPSYSEMAKLFGYASKNAAYRFVEKLIEEGFVERDDSGKIVPKGFVQGVSVLGLVEAGFPSPAEEELSDTMTIDEYLIEKREATYLLKVKGDSMIDAGIREGDLVVVERTVGGKVGDIVIAEVDGEWTMKYLKKHGNRFFLQPANEEYPPIYPENGMSIAAVVKGVVRKY